MPSTTFLPCIKFFNALQWLNDEDLGVQRDFVFQILRELRIAKRKGSPNSHLTLAAAGWRGYEYALGIYGMAACHVWRVDRGFSDTFYALIYNEMQRWEKNFSMPPWVGDLNVHRSHRSCLIRGNESYLDIWPGTPEYMPAIYPEITHEDRRGYRLRISGYDAGEIRSGRLEFPDNLHYDFRIREVRGRNLR